MLAVTIGRSASGSGASPIGRRIDSVFTVVTSGTTCSSDRTGTEEADASEKPDADASAICAGGCCVDQSGRLGVG